MTPSLTVDRIVEQAHALTDVTDPAPSRFGENLVALVDAANDEAELNPAGQEMLVGMASVALRNRIEVDRYVAEHPEVDTEPVPAPIFLTGLPRSGTTYFQYLFDQDPSVRMLRTWEGDRPAPPPAIDPDSARRRREASAAQAARMREQTGGALDALHLSDVDGPQECVAILDQTFVNPGLLWTMAVPSYLTHLLDRADLATAYRHHAEVLRLLQSGAPARQWVLKWPCHLLALDAIVAVHPDARFVVTHRDPVQALASNCSLTRVLRRGTSPNAAPHQIGRDMLELIGRHVDGLVAFDEAEAARGSRRVVHVDYYQLVDDPAPVMASVFDALGFEWTPAVASRVEEWRARNPKGKRGSHDYDLAEFGLAPGQVREAFESYVGRFDVPAEADAG